MTGYLFWWKNFPLFFLIIVYSRNKFVCVQIKYSLSLTSQILSLWWKPMVPRSLNTLTLEIQLAKQMFNNFIVQFLKGLWFSLKPKPVTKVTFQTLCIVTWTDVRYLNEVHGKSKSWHICVPQLRDIATNCYRPAAYRQATAFVVLSRTGAYC